MNSFEPNIENLIKNLIGKNCCRKKAGRMNSLSLGFGDKLFHGKSNISDTYYGEWEIGTYIASWRIAQSGRILCGSQDDVESHDELDKKLRNIPIGKIFSISLLTQFDIRVELESDMCVDFLSVTSEEDEIFHVFCPEKKYVEYSVKDGWKAGESNKPW